MSFKFGNIITVGPFAIDEGLVEAVNHNSCGTNTNTNKIIEQHVRVKMARRWYMEMKEQGVFLNRP